MRIIFADDEKSWRQLLPITAQNAISGANTILSIDTVVNGEELVQHVKEAEHSENPYKHVFTDAKMPVVGGIEAIQTIRTFSDVPISMISGASLRQEALAAGANGYADKVFPVVTSYVEDVIKRLVSDQYAD